MVPMFMFVVCMLHGMRLRVTGSTIDATFRVMLFGLVIHTDQEGDFNPIEDVTVVQMDSCYPNSM